MRFACLLPWLNVSPIFQKLADRISGVFVPIVIALALGTLAVWLLTGSGLTAEALDWKNVVGQLEAALLGLG